MLLAVASLALASAGCGTPPELRRPVPVPTTSAGPTATATPTVPPAPVSPPPAVPSPTAGSDLVATTCREGPSGDRVITLLRGSADVLPRSVGVRVRTGPLCAGEWQYTVLRVTGHEELQVVTRNRSGALELVTAGTDVCTIEVRVAGPTGIRTLACDAVPGGVPGA
ncbi:hypothetical protein OOK41_02960 [Micromonospora sp. NBC_01655]|uniref:hypothetical protein n=1 Tax=Micromonospora sp. NBC_01655 TaxID=2975983 RepID=UPI002255E7A4|nr:hypothetical protein [Micromonospora sp. NBC_01655]MCX4469285.1 hypothetical protein [Micromonospora sp. NBC_01655]